LASRKIIAFRDNTKAGTAPNCRMDMDAMAQEIRGSFNDEQPEPETVSMGAVGALESREHPRQGVWVDASAAIVHLDA
jgi:hypothetical protein